MACEIDRTVEAFWPPTHVPTACRDLTFIRTKNKVIHPRERGKN